MDAAESIETLGRFAGSMLKPLYGKSEVNPNVPYFYIDDKRSVGIYNFESHDNADRLPFFADYLKHYVFPGIPKEVALDGYYNIELHDTYSYLNNGVQYKNCLAWSRQKKDTDVVLIPDLYQLVNYSGKLAKRDIVPWDRKRDKIGFFGTTTGSRDPLLNERIATCIWGLGNQDISDLYITKVAQIEPSIIHEKIPKFKSIFHPPVMPEYLHNYRFLLDIPGNTCSWDRVPLVLNSKSILFKMPCKDMCWYYPLLRDKEHYVGVDTNDMRNKFNYYLGNPKECLDMVEKANMFTQTYLGVQPAIKYLQSLFMESSRLHSR